MKEEGTNMKKVASLLLVLAMLFTMLPTGAFAADGAAQSQAALSRLGLMHRDDIAIDRQETDEAQVVSAIIVLEEDRLELDSSETLLSRQADLQQRISKEVLNGQAVQVGYSYTKVTNGFSAVMTYGQLLQVRQMEGVEAAFVAPEFRLSPDMTNSNKMVGGGNGLYNKTGYHGEGMLVAILDTGMEMTHELFQGDPEQPRLTREGLQKLLEDNDMQCEAIVPSAGASQLYHSAKIPFQFDYGEKDANASDGDGHGTHVAGTAAGNDGVKEGLMGVAPEAQILNMKVFRTGGGASYDDILAALEDCMILGVDAANLSLGSDCGFISYEDQDAWTMNLVQVFDRVGKAGIDLAVAVGNAYSAAYQNSYGGRSLVSNPDYGNASEPSTYGECLSVASVENDGLVSPYITVADRKIAYYDGYDADTQLVTTQYALRTLGSDRQWEYVPVPGNGEAADYEGLDVQGKLALVQRGGIFYEEKARAAQAAGAAGLLVYNNQPGMVYMSMSAWYLPVAFVSQADGAFLMAQERKTLTIAPEDQLVPSPVSGMSDFSSWGATSELTLKPEISAPGGNIYSSVPGNTYELMSGTSMASPHVAGGMTIVRSYVNTRFPELSAGEKKDMVDTLLMSTASIVYDYGKTVPVSPRKQGAGMMDLNAAVLAPAYLTVPGMERPKMELKDDPQRKGAYDLTFTVHNRTAEPLTYRAYPIVLTDGTQEYATADGRTVTTSSETSVELAHTFTTNYENNLVTVPANGQAQVTIHVTLTEPEKTLAAFSNGAYVEGWAVLEPTDGSAYSLHAPFLAFYGDWTQAPIVDEGFYWDVLSGSPDRSQTYLNVAGCLSAERTVDSYLGDNDYVEMPYLADRNAISPNQDDFKDSLSFVYTGMLRSARRLRYTITGADGTVYYTKTVEYVPKSIYSSQYFTVVPAGVEEYDQLDPWYGTDAVGSSLPNNTKATVQVDTELVYREHASNNQRTSWQFPITVDTEKPEVTRMTVREEEGRYYATLAVTDNQYVAAVVLTDAKNTVEYAKYGVAEQTPGATTVLEDLDITGMGERIGLVIHDYAGNSATVTLEARGNSDDYADVTPEDILWQENFNDAWLPAGWEIQSHSNSPHGWVRDEDNMATVHYDGENQQDEWLITPAVNLSTRKTDGHLIFDFNTTDTYTTLYKRCNLRVLASVDGGENWQEVWNLQNFGVFPSWVNTQARVTIPEEMQHSESIRFAFVYEGKAGCDISVDNVVVYADLLEDYATVTAVAGAHGAITPAGETLVKKGHSKTFTVTPDEGYVIDDVVVDGIHAGPIGSYTFEKVGTDHTITASFRQAESGERILYANDFESDTFPGEGWSVKTTNTDARYYTWYSGKLTNIGNSTKIAKVDFDEYEDSGWGQGAEKQDMGRKQDEYLITPSADLTGLEPTLQFDYGFGRYSVFAGVSKLTVEASTDGGETWTTIWDAAKDLTKADSGMMQTGTCRLAIPQAFCTGNVKFAFRYYKTAYQGGDSAAIDNVSLTVPGAAQSGITVTAAASEFGAITPAGTLTVEPGSSLTFTVTPEEKAELTSLRVNGRTVKPENGVYTLEGITENAFVYASFESVADVPQVVLEEDFEGDWLPQGWTVSGINANQTWRQYKYYYFNGTQNAYISDDWKGGGSQDERLITPQLDLAGASFGELDFDYAYPYYGMRSGSFTFTVEASLDGSAWTQIWDAKDTLPASASGNVVTGTARVELAEQYRSSGVRFAFRFTRPAGEETAIAAVDQVKLLAVGGQEMTSYTIQASASQGGSITPSGAVSVAAGSDQSFTMEAEAGYEIADVVVDGQSQGKLERYTFEAVSADHTIDVSFAPVAGGALLEQDFESETFPGRGWTVKSTHSGIYTWHSGAMSQMNGSRVARVDGDEYDWSDYTTGAKQDEYLISPKVNLAGKTPTLKFDYGFGRYALFAGGIRLTVEASLDGGATWSVIWNAKESLENASGYYQTGTYELPIPAAFCVDGVQFAFHFYKAAGDTADAAAIDNVSLTDSAQPDPELAIIGQPQDYVGVPGENASFTVTANREDVTYQWYYSADGDTWTASGSQGADTATVTVPILAYREGRRYRCLVTDSQQNMVWSEAATLRFPGQSIVIVRQPETAMGRVGSDVTFRVEATGENLTYQWQYSNTNGATWANTGAAGGQSAAMTTQLQSYRVGQLYRCRIADGNGRVVYTQAVTMQIAACQAVITGQPADVAAQPGQMASFAVEAVGEHLRYQWQYSNTNGATWENSQLDGAQTAAIQVKAQIYRDGQLYRCIVMDEFGQIVSRAAVLTVAHGE